MSEENKDLGDNVFDSTNGKTIAIIAHLTLIGWIIAIIMNSSNKTEIGSFYIRQMLGIWLLIIVLSFVPVVNFVAWLFGAVLWIISFIGAFNENKKPIFLVGEHFQNWFKGI